MILKRKLKIIILSVLVLSIGVLSNASTVYITSENNITCAVSANPITLHTPNGSSVTAYVYTEGWTSVGKNSIKNYFVSTYPNATFISEATTTYNGNGYAWSMYGYGPTCWLFDNAVANSGMNNYWDDESYVETSQTYADIVYYNGSSYGHSAVPSSTVSGMYESKWNDGPLMRHAIGYGPSYFYMSSRKYYAKYPKISGHDIISNTYSGTFSVNCIPKNTTLSWSYDTSKFTKVSSSGTNIKLKPKTTSTVGVGTLTANFKNSSGTVLYSCSYAIYINRLPSINVQSLRVVRSSDGVEVYPSYVGLCPNTYYYAYITGTNPSFSYNWDMNYATVYSSGYAQAYFQTNDVGWTFLDLYATDTTANITEQIYGVTLYGGDSCN